MRQRRPFQQQVFDSMSDRAFRNIFLIFGTVMLVVGIVAIV